MTKKYKIIIHIFFSLLLLQSCISTKGLFNGRIARPDARINIIRNNTHSGEWMTGELSVNYSYHTSPHNNLNLDGYVSLSGRIINSYPKIRRMNLRVSFLDSKGQVLSTEHVYMPYSVNSISPQKLKFKSNFILPERSAAFCFSYSGEFRGDSRDISDTLVVGENPFVQ